MIENEVTPVQEDIELGGEHKTITFPVRVSMQGSAPEFGFINSLDEHGAIVLTPKHDDVEFTDAHTEWESSDYIMATNTVEDHRENVYIKEFTISITADALLEVPSEAVFADIDAIGQCVIYPQQGNTFISASINDSLNLVTEDIERSTDEIISDFMMGKLPIFTYDGPIDSAWKRLSELDSTHSNVYYDASTNSVIFRTV